MDPMQIIEQISSKIQPMAEALQRAYPPGTPLDRTSPLYTELQAELQRAASQLQEALDKVTAEGEAQLAELQKAGMEAAQAAKAQADAASETAAAAAGADLAPAKPAAPAVEHLAIHFQEKHIPDAATLKELLTRLLARVEPEKNSARPPHRS
jgi:hypothetical protein